jgi:hypothetical protein
MEQSLMPELETTDHFYEFHREFYKGYFAHDTNLDDRLFIRDEAENTLQDEVEVVMGDYFCVGCYWASRVLANDRLKVYLKAQLDALRTPQ